MEAKIVELVMSINLLYGPIQLVWMVSKILTHTNLIHHPLKADGVFRL